MTASTQSITLISDCKQKEYYAVTGITSLDSAIGGLARGAITEITAAGSGGRTSLALRALASATARLEYCAWVDATGSLHPASLTRAGVDLERLIWVRSANDAEKALRAADLLVHGGGFGMVCLDLAGLGPRELNRVPASYWFRMRRAVANTPSVVLVLADRPTVGSCAAASLRFVKAETRWCGTAPARLFGGLRSHFELRRPGPPRRLEMELAA